MKIHIISGFLGAGKTTFLNKYLSVSKEDTVVIENEFGDIGIDGQLIDKDIKVKEILSGCICCSLFGNFQEGIKEIYRQFEPEQIIIEPSGVSKLSDVIRACISIQEEGKIPLDLSKVITIVDAESHLDYLEDFGAFYQDQIRHAKLILLSNLDQINGNQEDFISQNLKLINPDAILYTGDFREMDQDVLLELLDETQDYKEHSALDEGNKPVENPVFTSLSLLNIPPITESDLEKTLDILQEGAFGKVARAKGMIDIVGKGRCLLQYKPNHKEISLIEVGKAGGQSLEETKLVFIGNRLDEEGLKKRFME